MALTPSGNFTALRQNPVNRVQYHVEMDLNDYAAAAEGGAAAAGTVFSPDWPVGAVIDGDRTHINAGAAGVAENGIGGGVYQGTVVSGGGGVLSLTEYIIITFAQPQKINRLKLIFWPAGTLNGNLGAIAPADYLISIAANLFPGYGEGGFGEGGYGEGVAAFSPWTGLKDVGNQIGKGPTTIVAGQVTGNTQDMNVFQDPTLQTVQRIKIEFSKLQAVGVTLRVVEIEATRTVDLSPDIRQMDSSRKKDYRLNHRLSGEFNMTLLNYDRKYSPDHVATTQEIAAGFFNSELGPEIEVRAFLGYGGSPGPLDTSFGSDGALVQIFTGFLYAIAPDGKSRICQFKCRDYLKYFIGQNVTTPLKSNKTIEQLEEYLANLKNFPSNLMQLDTSTIVAPFFLPKDQEVMKLMQDLGDATGDSEVYIDEMGQFHFRSYLNVISHIFSIANQANFLAGTLVNTDATTTPGAVILAKTGPDYDPAGDWFSALSPVLLGKVAFGQFQAIFSQGTACNIDFFIRATNDGGVTFTPWREIIPGNDVTKINPWSQVQFWARFRTSNPAQTPSLTSITMKYKSRGGSAKVAATAAFTFSAGGDLRQCKTILTSEIGGDTFIVTDSLVTANPSALAQGQITAWSATVGNNPISGTNPLQVPIGQTVINIDFGQTQYGVPQTVVMTLGTAVAIATLTSDPSKPTLTITATVAGTITDLHLTGFPFIKPGAISAETLAPVLNIKRYGRIVDTLTNDFIDNVDLASDISKSVIQRFQAPLEYLQEAEVALTPDIQIDDRATIIEPNQDIDFDFYAIAVMHSLQVTNKVVDAQTKLGMIKINVNTVRVDPFKFDQGKFDSFRFGGVRTL